MQPAIAYDFQYLIFKELNRILFCRVAGKRTFFLLRNHCSFARNPDLVGVAGFEPATSSLSGMRSNQLSYTPETAGPPAGLVELIGFEPTTS